VVPFLAIMIGYGGKREGRDRVIEEKCDRKVREEE